MRCAANRSYAKIACTLTGIASRIHKYVPYPRPDRGSGPVVDLSMIHSDLANDVLDEINLAARGCAHSSFNECLEKLRLASTIARC